MRILVLGADGYLGWPTMCYLAKKGHAVIGVDNYSKRVLCSTTERPQIHPTRRFKPEAGTVTCSLSSRQAILYKEYGIVVHTENVDCKNIRVMENIFKLHKPDVVIHYAEQPSAPYSMIGFKEAEYTLNNNLKTTLVLAHCVRNHAPDAHIVKLGTLGEYATPDYPIKEGWLEPIDETTGKKHRFLYPMSPGSLYHVTKVQDTHMLWFYSKCWGLTVTDIMQGPVYGMRLEEFGDDPFFFANFHYDDVFGTVLNRFLAQALIGSPLTIYGKGGQTRGYLNINDVMQCIELLINNPPPKGDFRIVNQFTETFSIQQLAGKVSEAGAEMGLTVKTQSVENPRMESEQHYYNVEHEILRNLGLISRPLTTEILVGMLEDLLPLKKHIDAGLVLPKVKWR